MEKNNEIKVEKEQKNFKGINQKFEIPVSRFYIEKKDIYEYTDKSYNLLVNGTLITVPKKDVFPTKHKDWFIFHFYHGNNRENYGKNYWITNSDGIKELWWGFKAFWKFNLIKYSKVVTDRIKLFVYKLKNKGAEKYETWVQLLRDRFGKNAKEINQEYREKQELIKERSINKNKRNKKNKVSLENMPDLDNNSLPIQTIDNPQIENHPPDIKSEFEKNDGINWD